MLVIINRHSALRFKVYGSPGFAVVLENFIRNLISYNSYISSRYEIKQRMKISDFEN